jgi:2-oxoglutarate dehydrogenase complex dehydrogenase (E1) component-like enzyme
MTPRAILLSWALSSAGAALATPAMLEHDPEDLASCTEAQIQHDADDPDAPCFVPRTCAECRTDSECESLCRVPGCTHKGQTGCFATIGPDGETYP